MQTIFVQDLSVDAFIGVGAHERAALQVLRVDVEITVPHERAQASDRIQDTIDYAAVAALIGTECASQRFSLLERLAGHLCDALEARFGAAGIRLRIAKTGIVPRAAQVGIVVERGRASPAAATDSRSAAAS
ncbi:MAG: dihydroneopterin aldolase [Lautropia sp.]